MKKGPITGLSDLFNQIIRSGEIKYVLHVEGADHGNE